MNEYLTPKNDINNTSAQDKPTPDNQKKQIWTFQNSYSVPCMRLMEMDGLHSAQPTQPTANNIKHTENTATKDGLAINKNKTRVLIYDDRQTHQEIGGIRTGDNIIYRGFKITCRRNCFK